MAIRNEKGQFVKGNHYNINTEFKKGSCGFNKKHTIESKLKMRMAKLGTKVKPYKKLKKWKWSEEKKLKFSIKMKGKIMPKGKYARNWQGGKTSKTILIRESKEYKLWRVSVYKRDNYTCIWCGQIGGDLQADHIKPFCLFPELRFAIDNGRTLCKKCHKTTETYGYKINNYKKNIIK